MKALFPLDQRLRWRTIGRPAIVKRLGGAPVCQPTHLALDKANAKAAFTETLGSLIRWLPRMLGEGSQPLASRMPSADSFADAVSRWLRGADWRRPNLGANARRGPSAVGFANLVGGGLVVGDAFLLQQAVELAR